MEKHEVEVIRIYTDGSGRRSDGTGSAIAWLREDTGEKKIIREDGLTNNQAEYRAILVALESVPNDSNVEIFTDSENTCFQLKGEHRVKDPHLAALRAQILAIIEKSRLNVTFAWIPRRENKAGKLI